MQQAKEFVERTRTSRQNTPHIKPEKSASHNDLAVQQVVQPAKSAVLPAAAIPISRTSSTFTLPPVRSRTPIHSWAKHQTKQRAKPARSLSSTTTHHSELTSINSCSAASPPPPARFLQGRSGRGSLAPSASSARNSREKTWTASPPHNGRRLPTIPNSTMPSSWRRHARRRCAGLAQIAATRGLELGASTQHIYGGGETFGGHGFRPAAASCAPAAGALVRRCGPGKARRERPPSSEEIPDGLILRGAAGPSAAESSRESTHHCGGLINRAGAARPSLVIRRLRPAEDEYDLSEYSPPNKSRAGQFARLEKQGRLEEALEREKRRVERDTRRADAADGRFPLRQTSPHAYSVGGLPLHRSRVAKTNKWRSMPIQRALTTST